MWVGKGLPVVARTLHISAYKAMYERVVISSMCSSGDLTYSVEVWTVIMWCERCRSASCGDAGGEREVHKLPRPKRMW